MRAGCRECSPIDADRLQKLRAFDFLGSVDPLGRNDLDHGDELAIGDLAAQSRALLPRERLPRDGLPARSAALERVYRGSCLPQDATSSRGCVPAWFRSIRRPGNPDSDKLPGVAGHVLGRTQIDVASFHRARHTGVGLRRKRNCRYGAHPLHGIEHGDRADAAVAADDVGAPLLQAAGRSAPGLSRRDSCRLRQWLPAPPPAGQD